MKVRYSGHALRGNCEAAGLEISDEGSITLVERGEPLPSSGLCLLFDGDCLSQALQFLKQGRKNEQSPSSDFIPCRDDERIVLIKSADIEFVSADGDSVVCNLRDGRTLDVKKKLYELESVLFDRGFFRVNKSALVNVLEIKDISPWFGGRLLLRLKNGRDEIEVSRKYVADFKEYLGV